MLALLCAGFGILVGISGAVVSGGAWTDNDRLMLRIGLVTLVFGVVIAYISLQSVANGGY